MPAQESTAVLPGGIHGKAAHTEMRLMIHSNTGLGFLASLSGTEPYTLRFAAGGGATADDLGNIVRHNAAVWCSNPPSSIHVVEKLAAYVNSVAHGIQAEWRTLTQVLLMACPDLEAVEANLRHRSDLAWWWSDIDRLQQRALLTNRKPPLYEPSLGQTTIEERLQGSAWWVSPTRALVTARRSSPNTGLVAGRLLDDYCDPFNYRMLPQIEVNGHSKVYEVHTMSDWAALVSAHPSPGLELRTYDWGGEGTLLLPDWSSISQEWQGVHVSVAGYLNSAYQPLQLAHQEFTVLSGWHPDGTVWLSDPTRGGADLSAERGVVDG